MSFKTSEGTELIATEDVFLTAGHLNGDKTVVGAGDPRAAILLARKGHVIPAKQAKQLGLTKDSKVSKPPPPPVVAPDDIESRSTRPESVKATR